MWNLWKAEVATGTRRSAVTNGRPWSRNREVPAAPAGFERREGTAVPPFRLPSARNSHRCGAPLWIFFVSRFHC